MSTDPRERTQIDGQDGAETLASRAERCRRLAAGISDRQAADVLRSMALQYEEYAKRLSQ